MEIFTPGTEILIAHCELRAFINCAALYAHGGTLYEVVWWKDGTRNSAWLNESEIVPTESSTAKKKVGFI